ncbi:hypothetical protein MACH09_44640 [Vibrio sp. MACH09]|nr:hypothetical protein MACH09_44640 [Vibrio sp. MACH09]
MIDSLSLPQARKLILHCQKLPSAKQSGTALSATLSAFEHLSYIQIDTISVIQRAHHHTLWNRNPRYNPTHIDQLLDSGDIFEYWSHAASYLPMSDYRYTLPRKQTFASGQQKHWFRRDEGLMTYVKDRIAAEGPLMAKDFESQQKKVAGWGSKPTKQALENLFMQGDLMVPRRKNFHKVYDLTERVLPTDVDTRMPSDTELARYLINRYLTANGLGQANEICYLLKNTKSLILSTLKQMVYEQELCTIKVNNILYYTRPSLLQLLNKPLARSKLKILSPFDNLVIQRKRLQAIFQFDYLLECYVPEAKREYGYFCLPIMWNGQVVARMDCKADRKLATLHINHLAVEEKRCPIESFLPALVKELQHFTQFNLCQTIEVHKTTPAQFKQPLQTCLNE